MLRLEIKPRCQWWSSREIFCPWCGTKGRRVPPEGHPLSHKYKNSPWLGAVLFLCPNSKCKNPNNLLRRAPVDSRQHSMIVTKESGNRYSIKVYGPKFNDERGPLVNQVRCSAEIADQNITKFCQQYAVPPQNVVMP